MTRSIIIKAGRKTVWDHVQRHHLQKHPRWIDGDGVSRPGHQHYLFSTWRCMYRRCHDKDFPDYEGWGARGIVVCKRWHTFQHFVDDVETLPFIPNGVSLDRINNDGNYELMNMRFADAATQARNRRAPHDPEPEDTGVQPCNLCSHDCRSAPGLCEHDGMELELVYAWLADLRMLERLRPSNELVKDMHRLIEYVHTGRSFDCLACATIDPFPETGTVEHLLIADNPRDWCAEGVGRGALEPPRRTTWREQHFQAPSAAA